MSLGTTAENIEGGLSRRKVDVKGHWQQEISTFYIKVFDFIKVFDYSQTKYLTIYIYIYVCVCVYVCVEFTAMRMSENTPSIRHFDAILTPSLQGPPAFFTFKRHLR